MPQSRPAGRQESDRVFADRSGARRTWGLHLALESLQLLIADAPRGLGAGGVSRRVLSFSGAAPPARGVLRPQVLLKAFVANLKSSSPTARRTAAGCAVSVCQHSRRTQYFYSWLLNALSGTTRCSCCCARVCSRWTLKLLQIRQSLRPGPRPWALAGWGMGAGFGLSTGRVLLPRAQDSQRGTARGPACRPTHLPRPGPPCCQTTRRPW